MDFKDKWISWINRCVSVASASVLVNETPGPSFLLERRLRSGCPLSPLLFNLVAEALPILVKQFHSKGWLQGY